MKKRRMAVLAATILPLIAPAGAATAKKRVVYGRVADSFTITLEDARGKPIKTLAPGVVTFRINDSSDMHNFHLRGAGFDRATDPVGTGRVVWKVTLKKGKWKFRCDVHPLVMHGSFLVRAAPRTTSASR